MTNEQIAPIIEELDRALGNKVPQDRIRAELERFIEHGLPAHQAAKEVLRFLSQQVGGVRKAVNDLTPADQSVDLLVKVVRVTPKMVTVRGEERQIWSGLLGDETGVVPFTAWNDLNLEEGQVLEIKNAYVTLWQQAPQVNLGDRCSVNPAAAEVDVPDVPEADEAAPAATSGGERTIADIGPNDQGINITAKVVSVENKEINVRGEPKTIWEGLIGDQTGVIAFTAWDDHGLETGQDVRITDAYVNMFQGAPQVNLGDRTTVEPADGPVEVPAADSPVAGALRIKHVQGGQNGITVAGRILSLEQRTINVKGEDKEIWEGILADETGRVQFTSWNPLDVGEGDVIKAEDVYVREFRGFPNLNIGDRSVVTTIDVDIQPPPVGEVTRIRELENVRGTIGLRIIAPFIELRPGTGLIQRCNECRRILQRGECNQHGRVEGEHDLRIKAVVDDGTGTANAILGRSVVEALLEKDLETCIQQAEEAMTYDIIEEEIEDKILGHYLDLTCDATRDDYGLTLIVREVSRHKPQVEERVPRLLDRLQEVAA